MTTNRFGDVTAAFLEQLAKVQDVFREHGCGHIFPDIAPETLNYCISKRRFTPAQTFDWCCNRPVEG